MFRRPPRSTLFPCTPLFRSRRKTLREVHLIAIAVRDVALDEIERRSVGLAGEIRRHRRSHAKRCAAPLGRSEEHTSELQSRQYLVCRLLLEKKTEEHTPALK